MLRAALPPTPLGDPGPAGEPGTAAAGWLAMARQRDLGAGPRSSRPHTEWLRMRPLWVGHQREHLCPR